MKLKYRRDIYRKRDSFKNLNKMFNILHEFNMCFTIFEINKSTSKIKNETVREYNG